MLTTINEFKKLNQNNINERLKKAIRGIFSADETSYNGWTFEDYWNGFECPYFEKDEADKIMIDMKGRFENDKYIFDDPDYFPDYEEDDAFASQVIETVEGPKKVWAIGSWYWTWMKDDESIQENQNELPFDKQTYTREEIIKLLEDVYAETAGSYNNQKHFRHNHYDEAHTWVAQYMKDK